MSQPSPRRARQRRPSATRPAPAPWLTPSPGVALPGDRARTLGMTLALALVSAAGLVPSGCGGAGAGRRGPATYPQRVAARAEAARDVRAFQVRHNPTPCACPPWELLLGGHWQRARLVDDASGDEGPVTTMLGQAVSEPERRWVVQGELDDEVSSCGRGAQVVELHVTALGPPETVPPEPVPPDAARPKPAPPVPTPPSSSGRDAPPRSYPPPSTPPTASPGPSGGAIASPTPSR